MTNLNDKEFSQLKEDVYKAKSKYIKYVVPSNIHPDKDNPNKNRYTFSLKCPFCNEKIEYKNFYLPNKFLYTEFTLCKKCKKRIRISSYLYKIGVKQYKKMDFLKKGYRLIRSLAPQPKI